MGEQELSLEILEAEINNGKNLILIEPIYDTRYNVLIGTEKILAVKDIQKIRERCPEQVGKKFRVRQTIPHFLEDEKRLQWTNYILNMLDSISYLKLLPKEKKDFATKYLKTALIENDYIIWKLSQIKTFSKRVFEHTVNTCYIALVIYRTYSGTTLSGMIDGKFIEKLVTTTLIHTIGFLKFPAKIFEAKRIEIASDKTLDITQHPIEAFKTLIAEKSRHEFTEDILDAILNQEEFVDGSGGPRGIGGEDLSFLARILCVSSYFNQLLTGEWSFRERPTKEYLLRLRQEKIKFDQHLVEALDMTFKYFFQM